MELLITNLQRFCLHDGPGIRTVIFLKGCFLRCPWCCNPETLNPFPQIYFNKNLCLRNKGIPCKECLINVSNPEDYFKIKKIDYQLINEICTVGALGIYGKKLTLSELVEILKKDELYFNITGGGVTFSGGEPFFYDLYFWLKELKNLNFHICVETSLYAPLENLKKTIDLVDLYIVDIKILAFEKAFKILKGNLNVFFENIEFLIKNRKNDILFRFPVVDGYTNTEKNLHSLLYFIKNFDVKQLEIFSVHNLAKEKYLSLGIEYQDFSIIDKKQLEKLKNFIEKQTECKVKILDL